MHNDSVLGADATAVARNADVKLWAVQDPQPVNRRNGHTCGGTTRTVLCGDEWREGWKPEPPDTKANDVPGPDGRGQRRARAPQRLKLGRSRYAAESLKGDRNIHIARMGSTAPQGDRSALRRGHVGSEPRVDDRTGDDG